MILSLQKKNSEYNNELDSYILKNFNSQQLNLKNLSQTSSNNWNLSSSITPIYSIRHSYMEEVDSRSQKGGPVNWHLSGARASLIHSWSAENTDWAEPFYERLCSRPKLSLHFKLSLLILFLFCFIDFSSIFTVLFYSSLIDRWKRPELLVEKVKNFNVNCWKL